MLYHNITIVQNKIDILWLEEILQVTNAFCISLQP